MTELAVAELPAPGPVNTAVPRLWLLICKAFSSFLICAIIAFSGNKHGATSTNNLPLIFLAIPISLMT